MLVPEFISKVLLHTVVGTVHGVASRYLTQEIKSEKKLLVRSFTFSLALCLLV